MQKLRFPKLNKQHLYTTIAVINPVVGGALLMKNESDKNPEAFKSTLKSVHDTIKTDLGQGISTLGKGVKSGSKLVGGVFDKLMLPLICVSGIVLAILVLKK